MSENGVMDRPRRSTRNSLATASATPATPSSNPYKKPTYSSGGRGASETPTSSRNGTPTRGRRGRGRPPGRPSSGRGGYTGKPECMAVRADGRRSTGGSTASSAGGGRRGAATSGGRRSTNSSRYEYEYHYGSDFDSDQNESEEMEEDEIESEQESEQDSISVSGDNDSDSDYSVSSSRVTSSRLPSPPVPIWLDTDKVPDIPPLELPPSSDDLLLPSEFVVKAVEIYEPIRRFYQLVRLSPFRFEDFCAALSCEDQSSLLAEIHIQLLKCVIREEDANGTLFGPNEVKDSIQAVVYFVDPITWPETIRSYLESDPVWKDVHDAMVSVEYPFCGPAVRLKVLGWLVDQFLTTSAVREVLLGDGTILHEDHCRACNRLGELICCENCPAVYHVECLNLKDTEDPPDNWKCSVCMKHQVPGVSDCRTDIELAGGCLLRHERLGYDRHGRKYWFLVRRILVESEDATEVWYYSTRRQIDELVSRLDASTYESVLVDNIKEVEEDIYRHCQVTEEVTTLMNVNRRKTFLDIDNGKDEEEGAERVTRLKATGLYKLGQENTFKNYTNHFNSDPLAVGKGKNGERDMKRYMSHKFSLTTASECKYGVKDLAGCSRQVQITALRGALMNMETLLPTTLMHVNWPMVRKSWLSSLTAGCSALDFSRAMIMISACIRNAVYNPIWSETTGHVRFSRSTLAEREERKKLEKMDKKGKDDEDDRLKGESQYTKNPLPIRHQVYKQKGEEYRIHGRWGWIWLSNMRKCKPQDSREKGLLAGPHKHVIQVKNETGKVKTMLIDPSVYSKLMAKRNLAVTSSPAATPVKSTVNGECDTTIDSSTPRSSTEEKSEDGKSELENVEDSSSSSNKENAEDGEMKEDEDTTTETKKSPAEEIKIEDEMENTIDEDHLAVASKAPVEPKVEPMEVDSSLEGQASEAALTNGDLSCDEEMKNLQESSLGSNDASVGSKAEALMDTETPISTENTEDKPTVNGICADDVKEDTLDDSSTKADERPEDTPEETQVSGSNSVGTAASAGGDSKSDDSQNRKYKTELVNVSQGIASSHRILYPKVARRSEFLDTLLQKRLTLMSLEEKNLKSTYGEEMVAKAKPGLAQFEAEEKRRAQEAEEYPGEEVVDENLTLGGAYAYCCYSSECRKEALEFMKTKGKNRERIYEKICYSPMCRLKFCLQETTRFKQERLREIEKEKYLKTYKEIEDKRHYTLEGTSHKVCMKKIADCVTGVPTSTTSNVGPTGAHLNKKKSKVPAVKIPQTSPFQYVTSKKPSILVLAPWEMSKLARTAGRHFTPSGFFQTQKSGSWGWTYPCGRPIFRTAWQYKTTHANTMAAAAMQLRILYASIRWDDIIAKIPNHDGRNQVHTDTEIITSEILNHRIVGRFMERVQYLRRMHVVPIDAPKTIREVTPSRIGLRKRKRAELPDQTDPVVTEDWVDEEKLELWEIRFYGDRIDKKHSVIGGVTRYYDINSQERATRTKSGIAIKQPEKYDPSPPPTHSGERRTYAGANQHSVVGQQQVSVSSGPSSSSASSSSSFSDNVESTIEHVIRNQGEGKTVSVVKTAELMREKLETEMKMQRAVHLSKRDGHVNKGANINSGVKSAALQTPTASQQFQMQQNSAKSGTPVVGKTAGTPTTPKVGGVVVGKKFFSNRQSTGATAGTDGPILTKRPLQSTITINKGAGGNISVVKNNPNQPAPTTQGSQVQVATTVAVATLGGQQGVTGQAQAPTTGSPIVMPQQKLSVVRLPDGRLQVKGLLPGQHCYQTPDGKIHVTVSATQVQQMQQQQQLNAARQQAAQAAANVGASAQTGCTIPPPTNDQQQSVPKAPGTATSATPTPTSPMPVITSTTTLANDVSNPTNGQSAPTPANSLAHTQPQVTISDSQTPGVNQIPHTAHVVVSSQQSQQPVINISSQSVKSNISNTAGLVATAGPQPRQTISIQQPQQQIMIQQPNGQHVLIQGQAAQAILQQQKLNSAQRTVLQGSIPGQQLIKQVTTATGQQIAVKSPVVVQTSSGPTVGGVVVSTTAGQQVATVPGRIVIQDGKAVLIGAAPTSVGQTRGVLVNPKQVIQTSSALVQSPQQTVVRPQLIQTSSGTTMQLIQSGQGLHLISQQAGTVVQEQIITSAASSPIASVISVASTSTTTSSPSKPVVAGTVTTGLASGPSQVATVRHVLPDGRTLLMTQSQLNELGGRKVMLTANKVVQLPAGAGTVRATTQQPIIQNFVGGNAAPGTIQLVQGPGGQQFYIQSGTPAISQQSVATGVIQQQQQVQIVVPGTQLGTGQPLIVKKLVKTGAASGSLSQNQVLAGGKATTQVATQQIVNVDASAESGTQGTSDAGGTSQMQTTITRSPGLPISIVSPSKGKGQSPSQQGTTSPSPSSPSASPKASTVIRVSSPVTKNASTPRSASPATQASKPPTSQVMPTPPSTPNNSTPKTGATENSSSESSSWEASSQQISTAPQNNLSTSSSPSIAVPASSSGLLTPGNSQPQDIKTNPPSAAGIPLEINAASSGSSATAAAGAAKPKIGTPSKIVAQIFQTVAGPKVVIQGINPDELTPSQLLQLQQQIQRQLASQTQQQTLQPRPQVITASASNATGATLPVSTTAQQSSIPTILQKPQTGNPTLAGSTVAAQHLSPVEVLRSSSSTPTARSSSLSSPSLPQSPPPTSMVSPAKVLSPPSNLPPLLSPKNTVRREVVSTLPSVSAPSLTNSPAQPMVVARKSQARKSPIRPNNLDSPPPFMSPTTASQIQPSDGDNQTNVSSVAMELMRPLNSEQQEVLDDRRTALKEDIMEKKKLAATQMRLEAKRDIAEEVLKLQMQELEKVREEVRKQESTQQQTPTEDKFGKAKKRRHDSGHSRNSTDQDSISSGPTQQSAVRSGPGSKGRKPGKRKRRLFCLCMTPYDKTKFYIGCDKCNNWFHGSCIGVTQEMADDMGDYTCEECRDEEKLYCMCKQPYNDSQFYIQCDKCEDWFHGRCVGILQGESESIVNYNCPECEPNSDINRPNGKALDSMDFAAIGRLLKDLTSNRLSLPFRKPVSRSQVPNYYNVIKEPMDLQTVNSRLESRHYKHLREFIGDVGRIFENCRYFNDSSTEVFRTADNLEKLFVQKIGALRQNLSERAKQ